MRVVLLRGGNSGLRREELVCARGERLSSVSLGDDGQTVWHLEAPRLRNRQPPYLSVPLPLLRRGRIGVVAASSLTGVPRDRY